MHPSILNGPHSEFSMAGLSFFSVNLLVFVVIYYYTQAIFLIFKCIIAIIKCCERFVAATAYRDCIRIIFFRFPTLRILCFLKSDIVENRCGYKISTHNRMITQLLGSSHMKLNSLPIKGMFVPLPFQSNIYISFHPYHFNLDNFNDQFYQYLSHTFFHIGGIQYFILAVLSFMILSIKHF